MTLSEKRFGQWIDAYGAAWAARDGNRFGSLFEDDAVYYWTPLKEPNKGRAAIVAAFNGAVARQREIDFNARILYTQASLGCAHWTVSFTRAATGKRVHIDGILVVQFSEHGRAQSFWEWWHTDEHD
ncbi:MAG: nuclear transport factor 2 family protein [Pseudomonadota bacterium]